MKPAHGCHWNIAREDRARTQQLAHALDVPRLIAHLMILRGIENDEQGRLFLHPTLDALADPFLLPDMPAAVERLRDAVRRNERIRIFGDYDVDGICGTALLLMTLRENGAGNCDYAMPSRITEGYGISPEHVETAKEEGVGLIITVDNGISAREAADRARELGIDFIVTDHHPSEGELPRALAVINPKREGCLYPGYDASGTAVAFHLARAFSGAITDLDLVALGTIADIVPLRGENRILAAIGLQCMNQRQRVGLAALAQAADIKPREITSEKIAFNIAPRLNAAGRLGDGTLPLKLLLTESWPDAERIAAELGEANERRRAIEKRIYEDAIQQIETTFSPDQRSIVLASRDWHPGVIGIVAARLQTLYNRPVVLVAVDEEGLGRGSARSTDLFDMAGALGNCRKNLLRFGGHAAAAGLAVVEQYIEQFRRDFEEEASRRTEAIDAVPVLNIDAQVSLSEIDATLVRSLDALEPFGCVNPSPVFTAAAVSILPHSVREMTGGHLRMTVKQGSRVFTAVGFRMGDQIPLLQHAAEADIVFTPRFNTWRGETTIQLILKDVRAAVSMQGDATKAEAMM